MNFLTCTSPLFVSRQAGLELAGSRSHEIGESGVPLVLGVVAVLEKGTSPLGTCFAVCTIVIKSPLCSALAAARAGVLQTLCCRSLAEVSRSPLPPPSMPSLPPGGPRPRGEGLTTESHSGLAVVPRLALQASSEATCVAFSGISVTAGVLRALGLHGAPFSTQAGGCYVIIS